MATKKQLEAKNKKLQAQINALKGKAKTGNDIVSDVVETAKDFINTKYMKGVHSVEKVEPTTYTRKTDGSTHEGHKITASDKSVWIVGTNRFWKLKE